MPLIEKKYKALISSDWNGCLAPCGPFDVITFSFPELTQTVEGIFKQYTHNQISLTLAADRIKTLLPQGVSADQMDAYLDHEFKVYKNVGAFIQKCLDHDILFMINTTGTIGYFQRIFSRNLLPTLPVLAAHPMLKFKEGKDDPPLIYQIFELTDKARNTQKVMNKFKIAPQKVILMGDSGGDGDHFYWGKRTGARVIGSMTKSSLESYCKKKNINIDLKWGVSNQKEKMETVSEEMGFDFLDLFSLIKSWL